ncbi:MAG TPA: hypothetical protein PLF26_07975 [Blastocatellia bacterium]|nr:hypothetical protein [Blastocatellia bacterium]
MHIPRRFVPFVIGLAVASSIVAPRPVQASTAQAQQRLFGLIDVLRQKYPALRDRTEYGLGTLDEGATEIYRENFQAGTTYVVVAVGCDTAQDIDIAIANERGKILTADTDRSAAAAVIFEPQHTGTYLIGVNMAATTSGDTAHFAYQVFYVDVER